MTRRLLAPLGLAAVLAGCFVEDQTINPPTATSGDLFASYVAIGNSITAGFQSGGLDSVLQSQSYATLLAGQMGTEFHVPWMRSPGCPPPYTNIFAQTRAGGLSGTDCFARTSTVAPPRLNLVAVPGASVIDVLTNFDATSDPNTLTTFLLGGRTQMQAATAALPTFVTVFIGNNDVLGAALDSANPGDPALVTSPATFAERYATMMDQLDAIGTIQGGVLIGVVQVGNAPYLTQGRVWKGFEATGFDPLFHAAMDSAFQANFGAGPLPFTANIFDVAANCLAFQVLPTGDTAWAAVPFPVGGATLATANARSQDPAVATRIFTVALGAMPAESLPVPTTIDCDAAGVSAAEMANITESIAQYNAAIAAEAADRDWVFLDPNTLLVALAADPTAIRPFPTFTNAADPNPFGSALSLDGLHPSTSTHRVLAAALISAINTAYGTNIPALP